MTESLPSLEHLDLPVCAVNQHGRVIYWNQQASAFFDLPAASAVGHEWHTVVHTVKASGCCALCQTRRSVNQGAPALPVEAVVSTGGCARSVVLVPLALNARYDGSLGFLILASRGEPATEQANRAPIPIHSRVRQLADDRIIVDLTTREREILSCIVNGLDARSIAARLGITHATARNYVQRILNKLGARNKAEAVNVALTYNLLAS